MKGEKEEEGSTITFEGHLNDLTLFIRPHFLKVPPPTSSGKLETESVIHGPVGDF
jgi:hypothetical protein